MLADGWSGEVRAERDLRSAHKIKRQLVNGKNSDRADTQRERLHPADGDLTFIDATGSGAPWEGGGDDGHIVVLF